MLIDVGDEKYRIVDSDDDCIEVIREKISYEFSDEIRERLSCSRNIDDLEDQIDELEFEKGLLQDKIEELQTLLEDILNTTSEHSERIIELLGIDVKKSMPDNSIVKHTSRKSTKPTKSKQSMKLF
jgi:predicted  nucleic acid-binding Zn-ribbon protein